MYRALFTTVLLSSCSEVTDNDGSGCLVVIDTTVLRTVGCIQDKSDADQDTMFRGIAGNSGYRKG